MNNSQPGSPILKRSPTIQARGGAGTDNANNPVQPCPTKTVQIIEQNDVPANSKSTNPMKKLRSIFTISKYKKEIPQPNIQNIQIDQNDDKLQSDDICSKCQYNHNDDNITDPLYYLCKGSALRRRVYLDRVDGERDGGVYWRDGEGRNRKYWVRDGGDRVGEGRVEKKVENRVGGIEENEVKEEHNDKVENDVKEGVKGIDKVENDNDDMSYVYKEKMPAFAKRIMRIHRKTRERKFFKAQSIDIFARRNLAKNSTVIEIGLVPPQSPHYFNQGSQTARLAPQSIATKQDRLFRLYNPHPRPLRPQTPPPPCPSPPILSPATHQNRKEHSNRHSYYPSGGLCRDANTSTVHALNKTFTEMSSGVANVTIQQSLVGFNIQRRSTHGTPRKVSRIASQSPPPTLLKINPNTRSRLLLPSSMVKVSKDCPSKSKKSSVEPHSGYHLNSLYRLNPSPLKKVIKHSYSISHNLPSLMSPFNQKSKNNR